jgi:hypothetical protein
MALFHHYHSETDYGENIGGTTAHQGKKRGKEKLHPSAITEKKN